MPQIFKIGSYVIYFWSNEGDPIEPTYIHVSEGVPQENTTKIWLTQTGRCLLCHNNSHISQRKLRDIMDIIEARHTDIEKNGINILNNYIIIADTPDTPTPPLQLFQLGFRFVRLRLWGYR